MNVLFIVTRNEAELLRLNIAHHLAWGFDHVAIADNESDDATPDVIRDLGDAATSMRIPAPKERFAALRQLILRIESLHGPVGWVAVSDTDEFWWHPGGDLRGTLARLPPDVLGFNAQQKLFLPTALDPDEGPVYCRRTYRSAGPDSPLHTSYRRGKSIYRGAWARAHEVDDPHYCVSIPPERWRSTSRALVHHYMIDGEDSFVQKVTSRMRWNPSLRQVAAERRALRDDEAANFNFRGFKRVWWDIYATAGDAGLRSYYRSGYLISAQALPVHLSKGDLVLDREFADFARTRHDAPRPAA
ncbi:hypothetical protein BURK1_01482 [Burkholderiales bacterium]|nr:hypothetical protein BURK1_01482 [Burkholderiales bacterium]